MKQHYADPIVDLTSRDKFASRRPLLIAHRGGVLAPHAPENSLAAIRLAAEYCFDMVELDVREAADGVPVLYHDATMMRHTRLAGRVEDYTSAQLKDVTYLASTERIITLAEGLKVCAELGLGVMFDVKSFEKSYSEDFTNQITHAIDENGFRNSCVIINETKNIPPSLRERTRIIIEDELSHRIVSGEAPDLNGYFWFGMRQDLHDESVSRMQELGALVIPAMNTFRYPAHAFMEMARRDIHHCLALGVDGFQIDSVYTEFFTHGIREQYGYAL